MNTEKEHTENTIKILLRNNCPKLTARGKGELTYELGVDTTTEEHMVRIAENAQGGSFSLEWISVQEIESLLENRGKEKDTFKANFFTTLSLLSVYGLPSICKDFCSLITGTRLLPYIRPHSEGFALGP